MDCALFFVQCLMLTLQLRRDGKTWRVLDRAVPGPESQRYQFFTLNLQYTEACAKMVILLLLLLLLLLLVLNLANLRQISNKSQTNLRQTLDKS